MTDEEREQLMRRFVDLTGRLNALRNCHVVIGDPAAVEEELQAESECVLQVLGADWFERRDAE